MNSPQQQTTVLGLLLLALALLATGSNGVQDPGADQQQQAANSTTLTRKLFTYAGPLLPHDWSVVSVLNERVVIGFNNGSARNSPLFELEPKDRSFVERLQNGTVYSTPLSSAKEKIAQWSSSVTSTVSKFGKSFKDQFDSLINNKDKPAANNGTTIILN